MNEPSEDEINRRVEEEIQRRADAQQAEAEKAKSDNKE